MTNTNGKSRSRRIGSSPHARVALLSQVGRAIEVHSVAVPTLQRGEVLVEIEACTLCGSDLHSIEGRRPTPLPLHAGHEMVGRIVASADDARPSGRPSGRRITWGVAAFCGECFYCQTGLTQKCSQSFKYGHESHDEHPLSGGLADFIVLRPGTPIVDVPEELPWQIVSPANCATATSAGAMRLSGDVREQVVVICGAGMLGITVAAMADAQGAAAVVVADVRNERLQRARRFGATHVVDVSAGISGLADRIADLSDGRGADVVIDMSGANAAVEAAIQWLRVGGRLVLVGSVFPTPPISWDPELIVRNLLTIKGLHNYNAADLQSAVDFLIQSRDHYPWFDLVSAPYALEQVNEAVQAGLEGASLRVSVMPGKSTPT